MHDGQLGSREQERRKLRGSGLMVLGRQRIGSCLRRNKKGEY